MQAPRVAAEVDRMDGRDMPPTDDVLASWYDAHRAFLWGLCYRITGSAADADDVVQDVFVRACRHAPAQPIRQAEVLLCQLQRSWTTRDDG